MSLIQAVQSTRAASFATLVQVMEAIAPCRLAGSWDNVGVLVDAVEPVLGARSSIAHAAAAAGVDQAYQVLVTNDLTEKVFAEALRMQAHAIVTYHPTPFGKMNKFRVAGPGSSVAARIVLAAARENIGIYSPHSALDASPGGMNDWVLSGIGLGELAPLSVAQYPWGEDLEVPESVPCPHAVVQAAGSGQPIVQPSVEHGAVGEGRMLTLDTPMAVNTLIAKLKEHLGLPSLRVALPQHTATESKIGPDATSALTIAADLSVSTVAVCVGSGRGVLVPHAQGADVWVTGELSHHDVLAATAAGITVILTDHTNTERGYLPLLAARVAAGLQNAGIAANVVPTTIDADPLVIV